MIQNVIFDMGGVLVEYRPELSSTAYLEEGPDALLVRRELFGSEEWKLLDAGLLEEEEALSRVCGRLPKALHHACTEIFRHWHEYMPPNPDMPALIAELKKRGRGVYLCSNAALRFSVYRDAIPALALMDGILISAEERCVKPERKIYERLFQRFGLRAQESFFIDDLAENIEGARACGMDGYVFDGDMAALRAALRAHGIL